MRRQSEEPLDASPRQFSALVTLGVAGTIIVLSTLLFLDLRSRSVESLEQRDERAWSTLVGSLEEAVDSYVDALFASTAYSTVEGDPGPGRFLDFGTSLQLVERRPGFQVYGRASWVPVDEVDDYERGQQELFGETDLELAPFDVHPDLTSDAEGALVIDSVFPLRGNEPALGLDFLGEDNRRLAALTTRETGVAIATGPITLVQETGDQRAFLVMLAEYSKGLPTDTPEQRREAFSGVAYVGFRMGDLMQSVVGPQIGGDVTIYDVGSNGADALELTPDGLTFASNPAEPAESADGVRAGTVEIAGRQWWIGLESQSGGVVERWAPWGVLLGGIIIGLLAGLLIERLYSSKRRAVAIARQMTEELRQREVELERSNEELERFAFIASHDLQEPLRTITNYIGLVELSSDDSLSEETRRNLGFAAEGAQRMSRLVTELLEFARAGRDQSDDVVELSTVWAEVETNLDSAIRTAAATLRTDDLPSVLGDHRGLVRVFQNLVANSIKYRGPDAPEIVCTAERRGDRIEVRIRDNGIGIPSEYHEKVFGMFKRLHTKEQYEGTGMGLAIVRRILESNGGTIVIEPSADRGTTFLIELPAADIEQRMSDIRPTRDRVLVD